MKFFNWMQNKFIGGKEDNHKPKAAPPINRAKKEPPKEEFSDWPHGLLAIGTFGTATDPTAHKHDQIIQVDDEQNNELTPQEDQCSSPDFSEFTAEEVGKLQKELKRLLNRKPGAPAAAAAVSKAAEEPAIAHLPLDRFLNCPSSLEVDRTTSNRFSTYSDDKDEEEIDRTIRIILGRCKDVCEKKKKGSGLGKKSLSFLVKKMFACGNGFAPTPSLRDTFQESRMEKLMRTMLTRKMSQNVSRASLSKKYLGDYKRPSKAEKEEDMNEKTHEGSSKWDKTDSEYIVLEI